MRFLDHLKQQGYRPYTGSVDRSVYEYFQCETAHKARWYHKPGSWQCAGCRQHCETNIADGFQSFLMGDPDA